MTGGKNKERDKRECWEKVTVYVCTDAYVKSAGVRKQSDVGTQNARMCEGVCVFRQQTDSFTFLCTYMYIYSINTSGNDLDGKRGEGTVFREYDGGEMSTKVRWAVTGAQANTVESG